MPVQAGKSGLAAKLGKKLVEAHEAHKADETRFGNQNLPEGIEGGIAEVAMCKFDVYKEGDNKGQYYFMASAIVQEPPQIGGIPIRGLRTQIGPEPICDTPNSTGKRKTLADHWAWVLNELRKLGLATKDLAPDKVEVAAAALEKAKVHTRFRTWKGKKQTTGQYANQEPRVMHEWTGKCDYKPGTTTMVDDGTGEAAESNFTPEEDAAQEEQQVEESQVEETTEETGAPDLDALAAAADEGDKDAGAAIQALCENAGFTGKEIEAMNSWTDALAAVREKQADVPTEETTAAPAEDWKPKKGEIELYKPPKAKKPIECEILEVSHKNKTVDLKNLDDGRAIYKGVAWSAIVRG